MPDICYAQYHQKTAAVTLVVLIALVLVGIRIALWMRKQAAKCEPELLNDLNRSGWDPPDPMPDDTKRRFRSVAGRYRKPHIR